METIEQILAERMKHFRRIRGFNQAKLAEESGKSASAIAQIETCVIWPAPETVQAIADALKVTPSELYARPSPVSSNGFSAHDAAELLSIFAGLDEHKARALLETARGIGRQQGLKLKQNS